MTTHIDISVYRNITILGKINSWKTAIQQEGVEVKDKLIQNKVLLNKKE
jgi:hypothetical protein